MGAISSLMKLGVSLLIWSSFILHGDAVCNSTGLGSFIPAEKLLMKCLLRDYDPIVRPALLANRSVMVTVDSYTADILELNEKSNVLTTFLRLYLSWSDVQLSWKLEDFPDITDINIPIDRIWTPEIVLHNNVDDAFRYSMGKVASIDHNGLVTWRPHGLMRSHCQLDLTRFPFDSQTCHLWIGPSSYDMSLVNVTLAEASRVYRPFVPMTPEWDVEGYVGYRAEEPYGNKVYSSVVFAIQMKRKSAFIQYTLLGPSVVLAILTSCLFLIPVNFGERLTMAAAILISNVLLIVLSEGYLPTDIARLPIVAKYVGYNLSLITLAIVISLVILNLHRRDVKHGPVPALIRKIFLHFFGRLLCMGTVEYVHIPSVGSTTLGDVYQLQDHEMRPYLSSSREADDEIDLEVPSSSSSSRGRPLTVDQTLTDIRNYLKYLANKSIAVHEVAAPSHRDLVITEWQQVARIIDRLSFYVFGFVTFVFTLVTY